MLFVRNKMKGISKGPYSSNCYWPSGYGEKKYKICVVNLNVIKDSIVSNVDKKAKRVLSLSPTSIKETPHYQYALGNKQPYIDYLDLCRGITWARAAIGEEDLKIEFMFEKFDALLNSDLSYLDPPHEDKYIIIDRNRNLIDGLHRSVALLVNGFDKVPAAVIGL
tara:strand:+ start:328 stop:822 length:495 start_codon:yes stop_codon:yes gene_type:complete